MKNPEPEKFGAHSRRTFLKSLGTVAATAATAQVQSAANLLRGAISHPPMAVIGRQGWY